MNTVDWRLPFYGSPNLPLQSNRTMIGLSMTILMGTRSNDKSDVGLVADRRRSPADLQRVNPTEDAHKTLRLGPESAIGFAGAEPLANSVLARLFNVPCPPQDQSLIESLVLDERSYDFSFRDVEDSLNSIVPDVICDLAPPPQHAMYIILAFALRGVPMLASVSAESGWQVIPHYGDVWSAPRGMGSWGEQQRFDDATHAAGIDYEERMLAAIRYCSKYPSVNRRYTIRRLSRGFVKEEGIIRPTSGE